jgi:hypothetical protein
LQLPPHFGVHKGTAGVQIPKEWYSY